ncbi:MAG: hypothetical protein KJN76_12715 [Eudoraea sp.]|nr:hypothetical protein [Eudoraea sp.]
MLKFFRKIREKLIDEGNIRKYFFYAIGEILLVVIGILIALQINNWNQANSNNIVVQNYISNLHSELSSDLNYFQLLITNNEQQKSYIDNILIALYSDRENISNEKELILQLAKAMNPIDFSPKIATYQDLVSSGKMGLINPINRRQEIISHYNLVEQKSMHIDRELSYSWNHLLPFFNDKGLLQWRNYPLTSIDTSITPGTKHFAIFDLEKYSREFEGVENNLYFAKLMLSVRNRNLEELIQSTENLINEISHE